MPNLWKDLVVGTLNNINVSAKNRIWKCAIDVCLENSSQSKFIPVQQNLPRDSRPLIVEDCRSESLGSIYTSVFTCSRKEGVNNRDTFSKGQKSYPRLQSWSSYALKWHGHLQSKWTRLKTVRQWAGMAHCCITSRHAFQRRSIYLRIKL